MSYSRTRILLIVLLAIAAGASVAGNKTGQGWLIAVAFTCFGIAVLLIRRTKRRRSG